MNKRLSDGRSGNSEGKVMLASALPSAKLLDVTTSRKDKVKGITMEQNSNSGCSISIGTIQVLFIIFKLTDVIDWSWWWVLSPIWIVILLCMISGDGST